MSDTRILAHAIPAVNFSALASPSPESDSLTRRSLWICTPVSVRPGRLQWEELGMCSVIHEPTDEPEGLRIYLRESWPVVVLEIEVDYRVISGMITNRWQQS